MDCEKSNAKKKKIKNFKFHANFAEDDITKSMLVYISLRKWRNSIQCNSCNIISRFSTLWHLSEKKKKKKYFSSIYTDREKRS